MNKDEILKLLEAALFSCADPRKPGIIVQRMLSNPKIAKIIRNLKSDDVKDVRIK
jgi:hypothetical protein